MGTSSLSSAIESARTLVPSSAYSSTSTGAGHTSGSAASTATTARSGFSQQLYYCGTTTSASK
jgi:hypothetical protein